MKIAKKIIVSVLAAAMIVTGCPSHYVKADTAKKQVTLSVQSQTAKPGATVDVTVDVKDNPGILGAAVSLKYDEGLTLTDATAGDAFSSLVLTKPGKIQSPCKFVWDGQEITADDIKDGTILKLSFKVSDTAKSGESYKISVSCDAGDMVDADLNAVDVKTEDGEIGISAFTPGDLNEDNKINSTDVIMMRRQIAGGYEQTINEKACDVNEDGRINSADVILVRRYIAGGYGVNLGTTTEKHTHTMKAVEAKEATCTEKGNQAYYYCTSCGKYYSDEKGLNNIKLEDTVIPAKGHVSVVDAAVAATSESTGLTEGSHCGECGAVLVKQEVVPILENSENSITYHLYEDDAYLQKQEIENTNPNTYSSETGLTLKNISCEGYIFEGWYDGEGSNAKQVKQIAAGEKGNVDLYAHWTAREYTITFDSPLAKVDSIKYKVNEGATLTNPEWFGYTFMGWTDEKDNLVDKIPLGKTGNITLHANWTSKRNQTRPVKQLGEPIIYENDKDGQYLFAYEIGQMENVPLYTIKDFGNTSGLTISETITSSGTINESTSNSIVNSLAHSTTETTSWTLSKDWNDSLTLVKTHTDESGKVVEDFSSKVSENSVVTVKGKEKTTNKNDSTVDKTGISASIGTSIGTEALGTEAKIDASLTANQDNTTEKSKSKTWNNSSSKQKSNSSSESSTNSTALSSKVKYGSMDWVLESEVPDNATIVGEKWTYDYTTKITSSNSSVAGYTLYDSSWVWGPYGGWSGWSDGNISGSDSRKVETQSVPNGYATQYNYIRYLSADGRTSGPCSGVWGGKSCTNYQERGWGAQLACVGNQYSKQIGGYFNLYGSAPCWYGESTRQVVSSYKTQYRYADRSKVYTYYLKKVESKESTTKVEASDSISNVKRWVQYVVAK